MGNEILSQLENDYLASLGGDKIKRFKIVAGDSKKDPKVYILRILPPWAPEHPVYGKTVTFRVVKHFKVPGQRSPGWCQKEHFGKPCFDCEKAWDWFGSKDPQVRQAGRDMLPSRKHAYNVIDMDNLVTAEGAPCVQIWEATKAQFEDLSKEILKKDRKGINYMYGDVFDLKSGRSVRITCYKTDAGSGIAGAQKTEFEVLEEEELPFSWEELQPHMHQLHELLAPEEMTYEAQKARFGQMPDSSFNAQIAREMAPNLTDDSAPVAMLSVAPEEMPVTPSASDTMREKLAELRARQAQKNK